MANTLEMKKMENGLYKIQEFKDGKTTITYTAKCKELKNGLTLVDSRGIGNHETIPYGDAPARLSVWEYVCYVDKSGKLQGKRATYHNGKMMSARVYKDGDIQPEEKGLKGISHRLGKLFFGDKNAKTNNPRNIPSRGSRG